MHLNYSKVFASAASVKAKETLARNGFVLRIGLSPFDSYIEDHLWSVIMFRVLSVCFIIGSRVMPY